MLRTALLVSKTASKLSSVIPTHSSAMCYSVLSKNHGKFCFCASCRNFSSAESTSEWSASDSKEIQIEKLLKRNKELERLLEEERSLNMHEHTEYEEDIETHDPEIAVILRNNKAWVKKMSENDPEFLRKVANRQKPAYMYIGCSDSRVPANQIIGLGPGEVFVHRNVGNQVVGNDINILSGVEFAVEKLNVRNIIVTGHYDCGAVRLAMSSNHDTGLVENWIRSLRDIYRMHHRVIDAIEDPEERHKKFVEICTIEQCLNLYKTGAVQRKRKLTADLGVRAFPRIHAMVFDPKDAILKKLPVDFKAVVNRYRHIYDLY